MCFVFFTLKIQRELVQSKVRYKFFNLPRKKRLTKLKKDQLQENFFPVFMLLVQLALINIFCDNWKT